MKKCGPNCIPACLTCKEYDDRISPVKGKGYCQVADLGDQILVDSMHYCFKFECIDYKDE